MRSAIVVLAVILSAVFLAGCATKTTEVYHKPGKQSREAAQIDLLTCAKADVEARQRVFQSSSDRNSPLVRRKAFAAGQSAFRGCIQSRGYKRRA